MELDKNKLLIKQLPPTIYIKKRTEEFKSIAKSKRINIDYAEEATEFEWRFYIEGNKFLSKWKFRMWVDG